MLAGLPLYSRTLASMYCSGGVWVDACAVGLVCQGGIKKPQNISVETPRARVHAARVSHANTWEGLSVPLEFFLHLNLPQKVSYGSYHILILRERAPINMHVCITPPQQYAYMCVCVFEETQIGPWDFSSWVFWLCQGDHYCGVQGQTAQPEGPDTCVCLN